MKQKIYAINLQTHIIELNIYKKKKKTVAAFTFFPSGTKRIALERQNMMDDNGDYVRNRSAIRKRPPTYHRERIIILLQVGPSRAACCVLVYITEYLIYWTTAAA